MKILKNMMMKKRKYYKIKKDGKVFEGRLWVRGFFKHDAGYSAFVFIGNKCLGRLYINKIGILFNLKQIDSYNKIQYTKNTIKKHFRSSVIEYLDSFIIEKKKIKQVKYDNYLDSLRIQASLLCN